ncbi:MAG: hypothetical protein ABF271_02235 [Abyssibacter sp.]|uniref:hypothetical protein n=1 Tax=Abyssibacter sp. TaxID=2320200 RepID=UPI003219CB45
MTAPTIGQTNTLAGQNAAVFPAENRALFVAGYQTITDTFTLTASSEDGDSVKENAVDDHDFDAWAPTPGAGPHTLTWQTPDVDATCDYVGVRLLDVDDGEAYLEYSADGSTWTIATQIFGSTRVEVFEAVSAPYWRLRLTGNAPSLAVIFIGQLLVLRGARLDWGPPALRRRYKVTTNLSESGRYLGKTRRRAAYPFDLVGWLMPLQQAVTDWQGLVEHAETRPFFFHCEYGGYVDSYYCWTEREKGDARGEGWQLVTDTLPVVGVREGS